MDPEGEAEALHVAKETAHEFEMSTPKAKPADGQARASYLEAGWPLASQQEGKICSSLHTRGNLLPRGYLVCS